MYLLKIDVDAPRNVYAKNAKNAKSIIFGKPLLANRRAVQSPLLRTISLPDNPTIPFIHYHNSTAFKMKTTAGIVILLPLVSAQAVTSAAGAQATKAIDPALIGTWTTSSQKVVTGPGFYDPVNDKMTEPEMPGISYSFTQDGWYEEAYYRAVANRKSARYGIGLPES